MFRAQLLGSGWILRAGHLETVQRYRPDRRRSRSRRRRRRGGRTSRKPAQEETVRPGRKGDIIMTLLEFSRGTMLHIALIVFVFGVLWRLVTTFILGWRKRKSEWRTSAADSAVKGAIAVGNRSWPHPEFLNRTAFGEAVGYGYHNGLFAIVLLGAPHVVFWKNLFGINAAWWPTIPSGIISVVSVVTIFLLLIATIRRYMHPPLRRMVAITRRKI